MKTKERELLIKDIYARLPYGVICQCKSSTFFTLYASCRDEIFDISRGRLWLLKDETAIVRPYLRPMSSMSEEERKEYEDIIIHREHINAQGQEWDIDCFSFNGVSRLIDWLNAHHFDYRGLIEEELAIEAPENMYKEIEL